ncbi:MAG: cytochrome c3 family protein, partial [Gammaproteobacteria bacterium]|nr:cytochrome c3 family protein [Gammaproteobacteria bacterium]
MQTEDSRVEADSKSRQWQQVKERPETIWFVHVPWKNRDCKVCHNKLEENQWALPKLTAPEPELCYQCHTDYPATGAYVHGPVAVGDCLTCHQAHQSDFPKLLVSTKQGVCFDCHTEIQERLAKQATVHDPITEDCLICHYMHASPYEFLLRHDSKDICMQCHQDLVEEMKEFRYQHNAVSMGEQCLNCHDPHASPTDQLLKDFSMDICLECHDKKITTADTVIPDIKEQLAMNSNLHGPLREKNCVPCHNVHGSNTFSLLALDLPENFYAPFEV